MHTGPSGPVMHNHVAGGLFSSSLVPIESNVEMSPPPAPSNPTDPDEASPPPAGPVGAHGFDGRYSMVLPSREELALRHSCWSARRQVIRQILAAGMAGRTRLARWDACGSQAMLSWHKSGQWVLCQAFYCHDRFCYPCSRSRSSRISGNLAAKLNTTKSRFLTLTLASDDTPLSKQIDRLYRCFKTLRADAWWDRYVEGGCAFLEVTFNPQSQQWHPHLHPIITGEYLAQDVLSRKWLAITGNSPIVHIKLVPDGQVVARYVSKYAAKCMDDSVFDSAEKLSELLVALTGRRFCMTFGAWRGWKLLEHTPLDMSDFKPVGSLTQVVQNASTGDALSIRTLNALRKNLRWDALNPDALDDALPPV